MLATTTFEAGFNEGVYIYYAYKIRRYKIKGLQGEDKNRTLLIHSKMIGKLASRFQLILCFRIINLEF
jgi:hypothetical protein